MVERPGDVRAGCLVLHGPRSAAAGHRDQHAQRCLRAEWPRRSRPRRRHALAPEHSPPRSPAPRCALTVRVDVDRVCLRESAAPRPDDRARCAPGQHVGRVSGVQEAEVDPTAVRCMAAHEPVPDRWNVPPVTLPTAVRSPTSEEVRLIISRARRVKVSSRIRRDRRRRAATRPALSVAVLPVPAPPGQQAAPVLGSEPLLGSSESSRTPFEANRTDGCTLVADRRPETGDRRRRVR